MSKYELGGPADSGSGECVEALLLRFPDQIRAVQRRKSFRVPVAGFTDLQVKVWSMTEQANLRDKPPASRETDGSMRRLSMNDGPPWPGGIQSATPAWVSVVYVSASLADPNRRMPSQPSRIRWLRSGASPARNE